MSSERISVEMLDGGHPLIRFASAFAGLNGGAQAERIFGQIDLSIETMEEAITLRDVLSAFIAFHQGCDANALLVEALEKIADATKGVNVFISEFATEALRAAHSTHERVVASPADTRRHRLPAGECAFCDANPREGPSHDASPRCESGKHPHCTCDTCF